MANLGGFNWKVRVTISSTTYTLKARRVEIRDTVTEGDVTNFESNVKNVDSIYSVYSEVIPLVLTGVVTIEQATYDDVEAPFSNSGRRMRVAGFVKLSLFPRTSLSGGTFENEWYFPSVLVTEVSHGGEVSGLQPVTFTCKGTGYYYEPGQAAGVAGRPMIVA